MSREAQTLQLSDGRVLGYAEYGAPAGPPLFHFHGFPGARFEARLLDAAAAAIGVRVIAPDRPGMGLSSFQRSRRVGDWANDVAALADRLSIERFAVLGFSGGAPYALACAARIPERLTACGIAGGAGPVPLLVRFLALIVPHLAMRKMARAFPDEATARAFLAKQVTAWKGADAEIAGRADVIETLAASLVEAFRPGPRGPITEATMFGRDWGFSVGALNGVFLWHGEDDREMPVASARKLASRLQGCRATFVAGEGHLSLLVRRAPEIISALACP